MESDAKKGSNGVASPVFLPSLQAVTLLGGGPVAEGELEAILSLAPCLAAADGGASHAIRAGFLPDAVIGDLDSFDPASVPDLPPERVHHIAEQTSTDFDKALRHIEAPLTLALGFVGARIDHELAAYHTLLSHPDRRCILIGPEDVVLHAPARIALSLPVGTRLSLFPLQAVTGQSSGLRWPIDGLAFHPARRIGTSNETVTPDVTLAMDGPGMLLIVPRVHLPVVSEALLAAELHEPAN